MMYKALNDLAPEYLRSQFSKMFETQSRHLRSVDNELLRVPYFITCYSEKSFTVDGAKQWNSLPVNLRSLPNLNSLKIRLKHTFKTSENVSKPNCKSHIHISRSSEAYYFSWHVVPFVEVEGCYRRNKYSNAEQAGQVWDTFPDLHKS